MDREWLLSPDVIFHLFSLGLHGFIIATLAFKYQRTQKDLKSQPLAMHCPSNGTGFYFFSRMNQKPGIWGRYLNSTRFCAGLSLYSVLIYLLTWAA